MKKSSLKALLAGTVAAGFMSAPSLAADLDVQPEPAAKEFVEVGSFRGSILLPGTGISFKVGGYAKGDVIFTFDDFVPSGGQGINELLFNDFSEGAGGGDRTRFHALQSRLNFDARTTTDLGAARAFIELDLFNTEGTEGFSNSANLRLRHAFAELGIDALGGSLLIGQNWTNFGDLNSYANTLDFNGPNAQVFIRQAQVRWTQPLTDSVTLSVAAENPEFLGAESGADNGLDSVPDFTVALKGNHGLLSGGTFHLGGVFRYLDVDNGANPDLSDDTVFGYGFQVSGTIGLTDSTRLGGQISGGEGIGRYIQFGPSPTTADADGDLEAQAALGGLGWIQHKWTKQLQSNLVGGYFSNLEGTVSEGVNTGDTIRGQFYSAVNLIYSPRGNINIGIEGLYGRNINTGGLEDTDAFRLQTSLQFSF